MKQQVFYIHGGEAFSDYSKFINRLKTKDIWDLPGVAPTKTWTSTLGEDLGDDFEVFTPRMPNSQNAKYEEWKIWFERHFEHLRDDVTLIGCSLGAMFLVKYLSQNQFPLKIKEVILMASPVEFDGFDDEDCGDFVFSLKDVRGIEKNTENITIMHSKDDFLVPYEHALALHEALPTSKLITFTDKNHFLVEELPELIETIKSPAR